MSDVRQLAVAKRYRGNGNLTPALAAVSLLLCLSGLTGCGSMSSQPPGSSSTANSNSSTALSLSPNTATLTSQEQLQFTARISGTPNTAVSWSATAGTISTSGFFTAPKVSNNTTVTITATSSADPGILETAQSASSLIAGDPRPKAPVSVHSQVSAAVVVIPVTSLAIVTSALPSADVSVPYSTSLSATGGVAPYKWSLSSGSLPSAIQLQTSSGIITGTAALTGSYPFTTKVTDAAGHSATAAFTLTVSAGSASGFDGPAELPRVQIDSTMANTPAPGTAITVNAGGDLQSALNRANCGDTIQLQAGATFSGVFTFPAKSCDDNHWIIVRSSADDSTLPAEGSRLTPCYAGVPSLPGRPALHCSSTNTVVAKLVATAVGSGPVLFAAGANHYRLIGLEITRAGGIGDVTALASVASGGSANNLVFDRLWIHGTPKDETTRGVDLDGSTYVSVVDSFFTDFHCISLTGSCTDSQAINGGIGSEPMGPYKIVDNFLEASGENILFGGGTAASAPADIQISQNHMFKPLTWMKGQPGYVGGANGNPFAVKNLFELKNAQRVLLEDNIMENTWGGFSQVGFAILLTPKSQAGNGGSNLCPTCVVTDVTIRYNSISHVGAGLQIANALSDNGGPALEGQRYSIHDIIIDDIDGPKYGGPGEFAQVSVSAGAPLLQSVTINHITAFPPSTLFLIGDQVSTSTQMKNFVFTNSIVNAATYPVWSTGGGPTNCAYSDIPLTTFQACFSNYTFSNNAIIAPPSGAPAGWPAPNFFPASTSAVQFVNYNGGIGGDYHLRSSSPYAAKGSDGKDLGADVDAINAGIAGVE